MAFNLWPFSKGEDQHQQSLTEIARDLSNVSTYGDPEHVFRQAYNAVRIIERDVQQQARKKRLPLRWDIDIFQYRPAAARIWNFFPNPFGVFSYLGENHGGNRKGLDILRREIKGDGYEVWYAPGASKDRIQFVRQFIRDYGLDRLAVEIAVHLKQFGNAWFIVLTNPLMRDGIWSIEILYPDKLYPIYDKNRLYVMGWQYMLRNGKAVVFLANEVAHAKIESIMGREIGNPCLAGLVSMMEADLYMDILNNMVAQRGGLLNAILSLDIPRGAEPPAGFSEDDEDYVEMVQSRLDSMFAGARTGQTLAAIANVKDVFKISDIGSIEQNGLKSKEATWGKVLYQLGVPSEEAGIYNQRQQYVPTRAFDVTQSGFDKEIRQITDMAHDMINKNIFERCCGIYDVRMQSAGRSSSQTIAGSQILVNYSKSGIGFTRNELRGMVQMRPLSPDDPRGWEIVDTSLNRDPDSTPTVTGSPPQDVTNPIDYGPPANQQPGETEEQESQDRASIDRLTSDDGEAIPTEETNDANLNQWF